MKSKLIFIAIDRRFIREPKAHLNADTVQVVQYSDNYNQPTTSLKSLKDLNTLVDNISMNSNRWSFKKICGMQREFHNFYF